MVFELFRIDSKTITRPKRPVGVSLPEINQPGVAPSKLLEQFRVHALYLDILQKHHFCKNCLSLYTVVPVEKALVLLVRIRKRFSRLHYFVIFYTSHSIKIFHKYYINFWRKNFFLYLCITQLQIFHCT